MLPMLCRDLLAPCRALKSALSFPSISLLGFSPSPLGRNKSFPNVTVALRLNLRPPFSACVIASPRGLRFRRFSTQVTARRFSSLAPKRIQKTWPSRRVMWSMKLGVSVVHLPNNAVDWTNASRPIYLLPTYWCAFDFTFACDRPCLRMGPMQTPIGIAHLHYSFPKYVNPSIS